MLKRWNFSQPNRGNQLILKAWFHPQAQYCNLPHVTVKPLDVQQLEKAEHIVDMRTSPTHHDATTEHSQINDVELNATQALTLLPELNEDIEHSHAHQKAPAQFRPCAG
ncbi:hypothetical protein H920_02714 [Fukomys damarensis]|uniref:Uncharacterized protein n=1 Tax=Fukomys damarensis TaxID=885580 RepID=A0A091DXP7_FUKDA|nr:hypothetical protein H920_02714 [Fukomys damarensis]